MRTETPTNWREVKRIIDDSRKNADVIWRGQSNASWLISSTLFRHFESRGVGPGERSSYEQASIGAFGSHFKRSSLFGGDSRDSLAQLVIMQHHGCPTRLIDWTWSPYVATYFAVHEAGSDSALYGLDLSAYQPRLSCRLPLDDYDGGLLTHLPERILKRLLAAGDNWPIPVAPVPDTSRQFDQQSVFLLDRCLDAPTEQVLEKVAEDALVKVVIPASAREESVDDLRCMNVDSYHLFRGRQGVALNARDALDGVRKNGSRIRTLPLDDGEV